MSIVNNRICILNLIMKHTFITLIAAGSTMLLSNAQDVTPKKSPPFTPYTIADIAAHDADKDGKFSESEYKAFKKARKAAHLGKYDTDKSGKLDDAEKEVMRKAVLAEKLEKFDTDKNGELDATEKKAMSLKNYDFDGDGKFSPTERYVLTRGKKGTNPFE